MDKPVGSRHNGPMSVCKYVRYVGRVQGVGFRYTAERLAEQYSVAGYVRNLPDGSVELVAQGSAEDVQNFLDAVSARMNGLIEKLSVQDQPAGNYKSFRIRH